VSQRVLRSVPLPGKPTPLGLPDRIHIDPPLVAALILLCGLSLPVLYSAGGEDLSLVIRQGVRIALAFGVMLVLAQVPPKVLIRWTPYLYLAGLAMLGMVEVMGIVGKGAQRWLSLGPIRFQPSELMKVAVPMMVAWVFHRTQVPARFRDVLLGAVIVMVPAYLVAAQPDLGTALLIAVAGFLVIFLAGLGWGKILTLLVLAAAAAPVLWTRLHDYQQRRVLTLFDPWSDPLGAGYHTIQAIIAVGSGGATGKGWLHGTQSRLDFIPERGTDFVFAVFAEEFGLAGAAALILLYLFVVARCLSISLAAADIYSRLLVGSIGLTLFVYVFVNIGMVTGIVPVVGVPLPLISYGGTSMVTLLAGFGIVMSIHAHRRLMA